MKTYLIHPKFWQQIRREAWFDGVIAVGATMFLGVLMYIKETKIDFVFLTGALIGLPILLFYLRFVAELSRNIVAMMTKIYLTIAYRIHLDEYYSDAELKKLGWMKRSSTGLVLAAAGLLGLIFMLIHVLTILALSFILAL